MENRLLKDNECLVLAAVAGIRNASGDIVRQENLYRIVARDEVNPQASMQQADVAACNRFASAIAAKIKDFASKQNTNGTV